MDIERIIDRVDIDGLVQKVDIDGVVGRVDLEKIVESIDMDKIVSRIDIDAIVGQVDMDAIIDRLDIDKVIDRVDIDKIIERVDIQKVIERVDINAIIDQVDVDKIVEQTELGSIIARSTTGMLTEILDVIRAQGVGLDDFVLRWGNRVIGADARSRTGPSVRPSSCSRCRRETVPVPSAELTVGRQGHYAGAVSRLVAFAADVGASWGLYTLGVALLNAAVKLVTGHSFTLSNHRIAAVHRPDRVGVHLFRLPVGGQREDRRHGRLRDPGRHPTGCAHQPAPGVPAHDRARPDLAHPGHRLPGHRVSAGAPSTERRRGRDRRRLLVGCPSGAAALDGPPGTHASARDAAAATPLRQPMAASTMPPCPSPKSPGPTPRWPSSR